MAGRGGGVKVRVSRGKSCVEFFANVVRTTLRVYYRYTHSHPIRKFDVNQSDGLVCVCVCGDT